MNKNELAERLYALPDGIVVKGRKSLLPPALLVATGVALLIADGMLPAAAKYGDLKSALVLFGGVIFAGGLVSLLVRLFGSSGVPLYGEERTPLIWSERRYARSEASAVADCLKRRDWKQLRALEQSDVASVRLVAYRTADDAFVACQAFEYVELEERPLTELQVVRHRGEA